MMATKARLHWFWRGAIATLLSTIGSAGLFFLIASDRGLMDGAVTLLAPVFGYAAFHVACVLYSLIQCAMGALAYGLLTRWLGNPAPDGELRCRKCGYILRGISEPRCPECGEAI
jgi:hypothetical protein